MSRDRSADDELTERAALEKACRRHLDDLRRGEKWPVDYVPTPRDGRGIVRRAETSSGCSTSADWAPSGF